MPKGMCIFLTVSKILKESTTDPLSSNLEKVIILRAGFCSIRRGFTLVWHTSHNTTRPQARKGKISENG